MILIKKRLNLLQKGIESYSDLTNSYFNPIIFGTEVYKHGENPSNFCKTEFHLIYNIYQTYLLISLKEFDLAKKVSSNQ